MNLLPTYMFLRLFGYSFPIFIWDDQGDFQLNSRGFLFSSSNQFDLHCFSLPLLATFVKKWRPAHLQRVLSPSALPIRKLFFFCCFLFLLLLQMGYKLSSSFDELPLSLLQSEIFCYLGSEIIAKHTRSHADFLCHSFFCLCHCSDVLYVALTIYNHHPKNSPQNMYSHTHFHCVHFLKCHLWSSFYRVR